MGVKFILKNIRGSITLEFAMCGIMFIGLILGMVVMGLLIYNVSQVNQAARIAAYNVALTGDAGEARGLAQDYLNKSVVACPYSNVLVYSSGDLGYGVAEVEMSPLFPGFQRLIHPGGTAAGNGRIQIRKEAVTVLEHRLRQSNRGQYN